MLAVGVSVNLQFTELWEGELDDKIVQETTDGRGIATFAIPVSEEKNFRYAMFWAEGDVSSSQHQIFWYTDDLSMPARIVPREEEVSLFPGRLSMDVVFFVFNAWGVPLSEVSVTIVKGQEKLYYPDLTTVMTYPFGEAVFGFSVGEEIKGEVIFKIRVDRYPFLEAQTRVSWDDSGMIHR